ncbi:hypothetical protein [Flavobacterium facile]|uniref:hypothetical protein n=1 Tax=Flavobacterium facile TaxID=2893174 RepID=UPI002E76F705|nr:hypothetical protein [Flavobacterium sp. T-12]
MEKFHQIATEQYIPISHDKSFLFDLFDKIASFIAKDLSSEKNYRNVLAKPVKNNFEIDFYSVFPNLVSIDSTENKNSILHEYWNLMQLINDKIATLSTSKDENNIYWANLLALVFNKKNNLIFSNGTNFCIVWGWEFENNNNYKPIFDNNPKVEEQNSIKADPNGIPVSEPIKEPIEVDNVSDVTSEEDNEKEIDDPKSPIDKPEEIEPEVVAEIETQEPNSFLEFLKWFASNYWWLLLVLTTLIIIVFFVKSLKY